MAYSLLGPHTRVNPFEREVVCAMLNNSQAVYFPTFEKQEPEPIPKRVHIDELREIEKRNEERNRDFFIHTDSYSKLSSKYNDSEALSQFSGGIVIPYDMVRPTKRTPAFLKTNKGVTDQHIPDLIYLKDRGDHLEAIPVDFKGKEFSGNTSGASANHYEPTQISPYNMIQKVRNSRYLKEVFIRAEKDTGKKIFFGGGCFISRRDVVSDHQGLEEYMRNVECLTSSGIDLGEIGLRYDGMNLDFVSEPGFFVPDGTHFIGNTLSESSVREILTNVKGAIDRSGAYPFALTAITGFHYDLAPRTRMLYDPQCGIMTSNPALEDLEKLVAKIEHLKSVPTSELSEQEFFGIVDAEKIDKDFLKGLRENRETAVRVNISETELKDVIGLIQQVYLEEKQKAWERIDNSYKAAQNRHTSTLADFTALSEELADIRTDYDSLDERLGGLEDEYSQRKRSVANTFSEALKYDSNIGDSVDISNEYNYNRALEAVTTSDIPSGVRNSFVRAYIAHSEFWTTNGSTIKRMRKDFADIQRKLKNKEFEKKELHEDLYGFKDRIKPGAVNDVIAHYEGMLEDVRIKQFENSYRMKKSRRRKMLSIDNDFLIRAVNDAFTQIDIDRKEDVAIATYEREFAQPGFYRDPVAWFKANDPLQVYSKEGLFAECSRKEGQLKRFEQEWRAREKDLLESRPRKSRSWFNYYEVLRDVVLEFLEEQKTVLQDNLSERQRMDKMREGKIISFIDQGQYQSSFSVNPTFPFPKEVILSLDPTWSYHLKTFSSININK